MQRVALHPLRASMTLHDKDPGEEATAAAFFRTPQIVKQRLRRASLNPYHARQGQEWDAVRSSMNKEH
jgi:ParB family chromosome partitioning protein